MFLDRALSCLFVWPTYEAGQFLQDILYTTLVWSEEGKRFTFYNNGRQITIDARNRGDIKILEDPTDFFWKTPNIKESELPGEATDAHH